MTVFLSPNLVIFSSMETIDKRIIRKNTHEKWNSGSILFPLWNCFFLRWESDLWCFPFSSSTYFERRHIWYIHYSILIHKWMIASRLFLLDEIVMKFSYVRSHIWNENVLSVESGHQVPFSSRYWPRNWFFSTV